MYPENLEETKVIIGENVWDNYYDISGREPESQHAACSVHAVLELSKMRWSNFIRVHILTKIVGLEGCKVEGVQPQPSKPPSI